MLFFTMMIEILGADIVSKRKSISGLMATGMRYDSF
jgi:hypothetical protein